jgi:hypothetical protein
MCYESLNGLNQTAVALTLIGNICIKVRGHRSLHGAVAFLNRNNLLYRIQFLSLS